MSSRSSQARTEIDRRDDYFAKPEVRKEPEYRRRYLQGTALQDELARKWAKRPERTNPDAYLEGEAP